MMINRVSKALSYFCFPCQSSLLVPPTEVVTQCPDCATPDDLNEPVVKDTVQLALKRFNSESNLTNYFTLENITRASSQVPKFPSVGELLSEV